MTSASRAVRGDCSRRRMLAASRSEVLPRAFGPTIRLVPGWNSAAYVSKQRKCRSFRRSREASSARGAGGWEDMERWRVEAGGGEGNAGREGINGLVD